MFREFLKTAADGSVEPCVAARIAGDWLGDQGVPYAWLLSQAQDVRVTADAMTVRLPSTCVRYVQGSVDYLVTYSRVTAEGRIVNRLRAYAAGGSTWSQETGDLVSQQIALVDHHLVVANSLRAVSYDLRTRKQVAEAVLPFEAPYGSYWHAGDTGPIEQTRCGLRRVDPRSLETVTCWRENVHGIALEQQPMLNRDMVRVEQRDARVVVVDMHHGTVFTDATGVFGVSADRLSYVRRAVAYYGSNIHGLLVEGVTGKTFHQVAIGPDVQVYDARLSACGLIALWWDGELQCALTTDDGWHRVTVPDSSNVNTPSRLLEVGADGRLLLSHGVVLYLVDLHGRRVVRLPDDTDSASLLYSGTTVVLARLCDRHLHVDFVDM